MPAAASRRVFAASARWRRETWGSPVWLVQRTRGSNGGAPATVRPASATRIGRNPYVLADGRRLSSLSRLGLVRAEPGIRTTQGGACRSIRRSCVSGLRVSGSSPFSRSLSICMRGRAKLVPAAYFEGLVSDGVGFAAGEIGQGPHSPDISAVPDLASFTPVPPAEPTRERRPRSNARRRASPSS